MLKKLKKKIIHCQQNIMKKFITRYEECQIKNKKIDDIINVLTIIKIIEGINKINLQVDVSKNKSGNNMKFKKINLVKKLLKKNY